MMRDLAEKLKALDELEAPVEWRDVREVPERHLRVDTMRRVTAASVAFAVFIIGGALIWIAFRPGGQHSLTRQGNDPSVAEVTCQEDGSTIVHTPRVRVQADGVHVIVTNRTASLMFLLALPGGPERDAPPGQETEVAWDSVVPGRVGIACYPASGPAPDAPLKQTLEVVDPLGLYASPALDCPPGDATQTGSLDAGAGSSVALDPIELVTQQVRGLQPTDELQMAGYPKASRGTVVAVRGEANIASFGMDRTDEGWLFEGYEACSSSGITLS